MADRAITPAGEDEGREERVSVGMRIMGWAGLITLSVAVGVAAAGSAGTALLVTVALLREMVR